MTLPAEQVTALPDIPSSPVAFLRDSFGHSHLYLQPQQSGFNAAFKAAGLHFRAHTCVHVLMISPGIPRFLQVFFNVLFLCPPSSSQSTARALPALVQRGDRVGNVVVPPSHIKTASISLNSNYPFPLQVTKGTVVLPCSLSQHQGLCFALEHANLGPQPHK